MIGSVFLYTTVVNNIMMNYKCLTCVFFIGIDLNLYKLKSWVYNI